MLVRDYMEREGIDDLQLAERLGKQVRGVRSMLNREVPRGWCEILDLPFDAPAAAIERERFTGPRKTRDTDDQPPRPHDDSAVQDAPRAALPAIADSSIAEERIAQLYGGLGFALSSRSGNPGYQLCVDDQAPHIARAWVKAAEENEFARRVVAMMSSGGATGELVMAHAVMVMGLAYVSGRSSFDPLGTYARKYGQFRAVVRVDETVDGDRPAEEDFAGDRDAGPAAALG
jgi:hypothetical protein